MRARRLLAAALLAQLHVACALGRRRRGVALRGGAKPELERRGCFALRGGSTAAKPVAKDFNVERTNWVDSTIYFLEHPRTELTIGTMAVALTFVEIGQQVQRLGVRDANWALLFLAMARLLKAFLAVLRSTRMALRGYKSYRVIRRGENVYLKHLPAPDDPQHKAASS